MMYLMTLFAFLAVSSALYLKDDPQLAMENPDLFGGDMLGIELDEDRNVISDIRKRWPNKIVPYEISQIMSENRAEIEDAMNEYHKHTCLRFVKRTTEKNYLYFFNGKGCYSYVGCVNRGQQPVSLSIPGCIYKGTIIHELGHAIGFWHEHERSDRDDYLIIYWENIKEGMESQFTKVNPSQNILINAFDYDSIMIYDNYTFSKKRGTLKTMEAKNGRKLVQPYLRYSLSKSDIVRVNKMYNCP